MELLKSGDSKESKTSARSRLLHLSRLSKLTGSSVEWLEFDDKRRIVRVTLDPPAFVASWRGVEVLGDEFGERTEHRDQMLSAFAELGVPLNAVIGVEGNNITVRDLLETSILEFHMDQKEIEWTATAFALYLPPQSAWYNRLGERYTFDELAVELMKRPLNSGPCRGVHLATTLTMLLNSDQVMPVLSDATRELVAQYLERMVNEAVASQLGDGSWPQRWAPVAFFDERGQFTPTPTLEAQVTIQGHLLEWFHWLPMDLKPPQEVMKRGTIALRNQVHSSSPELIRSHFCPYTHAIAALYLVGSQ